MRVLADLESCIGAGVCVLTAPDVFDQSADDGTVRVLVATVPTELERDVREAVDLCPAAALAIADEEG